jgi:hypothetical protein
MVGRVEVLLPSTELRIEKIVGDLGSNSPEVKKLAQAELDQLGRLREPVLRRLVTFTTIPEIRARAEALIKSSATEVQKFK